MNKWVVAAALSCLLAAGCKEKKEENNGKSKEPFFPVKGFISSQVSDIDTSLYSIRKILIYDTLRSDTIFIRREEVRALASDFLDIPDLADEAYSSRYKEEKLYDESLNRIILSYRPLDPDKEEVQLQEVVIVPNPATGDKVRSIIIDRTFLNRDSSVQKRMLWQVDQSFQVSTITQKPGQPEQVHTLKVAWNETEQ